MKANILIQPFKLFLILFFTLSFQFISPTNLSADNATGAISVAISSDTGISASDFITNVAAQTITGTLVVNTTNASTPVLYVSANGGTTRVLASIPAST